MFVTSSRRALAAVVAPLLALAGLVFVATPSYATSSYVAIATLSPSTAAFGSTVVYQLDIYGTDNTTANKASLLKVQVPKGFTDVVPLTGSYSHPSAWNPAVDYDSANHLLTFTAANANTDLNQGDHIHLDIQATASATGTQPWTLTAFRGLDTTSLILPSQSPAPEIVTGGEQHLSFGTLADKTYGDPDFSVLATSDGPGAISYTSTTPTACTVDSGSGLVHIVTAGSCTLTAHQAATTGYSAATDVSQGFTINKAAQTITFPAVPTKTFGAADFDLVATASSGLAVTYAATGTSCTVTGATVSIVHAGTCTITASQAGNGNYSAATDTPQTFTINPESAALELTGLEATYDGHPHGATVTTDPAGLGDQVTVTYDGSGTVPTDAGRYDVVARIDNPDYAADQVTGTLTIAPRTVTGHLTVAGRPYDGTTDAQVLTETLTGVLPGDDLSLTGGTASFGSADAGPQTATLTGAGISGSSVHNYALDKGPITASAEITPRQISGSITAGAKTYDGSTKVPDGILSGSLTDVVPGDDVTLKIDTASYADRTVGTHEITATVELDGTRAANYSLEHTTLTTDGVITARHVTGSFTVADRPYDGTLGATVTGSQMENAIEGDDVSLVVGTATFADKNVGKDKTVSAALTLSGKDAGNYLLPGTDPATTTAEITARHLVGSFTAHDKAYDSTDTAAVSDLGLDDVVAGEDVTLTGGTATYDGVHVGDHTVTLDGAALGGDDRSNYVLDRVSTDSAKITPRSVDGSFSVADKTWDGTAATTITGRSLSAASGDTGRIAGDSLTLTGGSASLASADVGTWSVTGDGFELGGDAAGDYALGTVSADPSTATISALYSAKGFYAPVDMTPSGGTPIYNTVKGGQTVPLKFNIYNAAGTEKQTSLSIFGASSTTQASAFKTTPVSCSSTASLDAVEVTATGGTSLRYDTTAGQYIQNWKTPTTVGACFAVSLRAVDGTTVGPAYFKITK